MANHSKKTVQAYLGDDGAEILKVLCSSLMLSKSAVVRLSLRKLYTSSEDDVAGSLLKL